MMKTSECLVCEGFDDGDLGEVGIRYCLCVMKAGSLNTNSSWLLA